MKITAYTIKKGKQKDPESCPLALALKRSDPDCESVKVYNDHVDVVWKDGTQKSLKLSKKIANWVKGYDETGKADAIEIAFGEDPAILTDERYKYEPTITR